MSKILKVVMALSMIFLFAGILAGCGNSSGSEGNNDGQQSDSGNDKELSGTLQIHGSTTVTPVAQAWAEVFNQEYPDVEVIVSGTGSGDGIAALVNGTTDFAMASRKMKPKEKERFDKEPVEHVVGRDGLAVIVHPDNPVDSMSMEEIKGIFTGEITNWEEVGGPDEEIIVYTRDTSSGTYGFFKEFVMDDEEYISSGRSTASNAAMAKSVAQDETSIGYCGLAFLDDKVQAVKVSQDGGEPVEPSLETAKAGDYPIVRDLNMYTIGEPEGLAKEFLDYGFSSKGQDTVQEVGYIPVE